MVLLVTMITFTCCAPSPATWPVRSPVELPQPPALAAFDREYGFDRPWFDQYLLWVGHLLQGNSGFSWTRWTRASRAARAAPAQDDLCWSLSRSCSR